MDAKPFPNAPVNIVNTESANGPETLASGSTGSSGTFSIQVDMRDAGTYVIVAQTYNGTNTLNDINSGPLQILVSPVFAANPKISLSSDSQTSNNTNIVISGSGFTPNGNVSIDWNKMNILNAAAGGNGNLSITTSASQIISASQGQLGSNAGITINIDAIDNASEKVSAPIPIYLYVKSQPVTQQPTANPPSQTQNGGNTRDTATNTQTSGGGTQGTQNSGGSINQTGQSNAVNSTNTNAAQTTPTVYLFKSDSSTFSGAQGSITNPYEGYGGWQGPGYYYFASKKLETANIVNSVSGAQRYFISFGGGEAQSPWQQVSGLPSKIDQKIVQSPLSSTGTSNAGAATTQSTHTQTGTGTSGGGTTSSGSTAGGSSGSAKISTIGSGSGSAPLNLGSGGSGITGISVPASSCENTPTTSDSLTIDSSACNNPTGIPSTSEILKGLKRAYETLMNVSEFPSSLLSNTTEAAKDYNQKLNVEALSSPVGGLILMNGWCSETTGVPSGYNVDVYGIGVGEQYKGFNQTSTLGPFEYSSGATGNILTTSGGVSGSLVEVSVAVIPCILQVKGSILNWNFGETISQNLSSGKLNSEGDISASAADLNLELFYPGKGKYSDKVIFWPVKINNNGGSISIVKMTSKSP